MRRFLPILPIFFAVAACATGTGRFGRVSDQVILFPTPPDTARIQFLAAVSTPGDVKGTKKGGWLSSILSDPLAPTDGIMKPYGVAVHGSHIYVCDTMLPGLDIIDVSRRSFRKWQGRGQGVLRKPVNCSVDSDNGRLYIADTERGQVVVFDSTLSYVGSFGQDQGTPADVFVGRDRIWTADLRGGKVHVYDKATFRYLSSFPNVREDDKAFLRQPTNLWVHDGYVYVSDFGDFSVKVYDQAGRFVRRVGSYGRALGQFVRPKGISVDRGGLLYVVDAGFENIQIFNPKGQLLMFFGGSYNGPGSMWLPAQVRISYENLEFFQDYVEPGYDLQYVILVTNQYGPDRLNIYGFVRPTEKSSP